MTLEELYRDAVRAKEEQPPSLGIGITLFFKKGMKKPSGFPRGELLNETEGGRLYSFDADKIIAWVKKQPSFNRLVEEK